MRRLSAILLTLMMPALAFAQSSVVGPLQPAATLQPGFIDQMLRPQAYPVSSLSNLQTTPLWSTPDGRILAIVALADNTIPARPQSPQIGSAADWKFVDVTNFFTSGFQLGLSREAAAYVTYGRGTVLGPLLTADPAGCAGIGAADSACAERATLARSGVVQFGADWSVLDNVDVDLSYGLAWFRRDDAAPFSPRPTWDLFSAIGNSQLPTLLIPGLEGAGAQNSGVNALGHWRFDGPNSLDLGASLGRLQLYGPSNTPLFSLNQAAVTFGLHYGAFSGNVTGRMLGPNDAFNGTSRWTGLDIGLSWRTPWQGQLSIGTQNLWSSGALPAITDPVAHEVDSNQARVPYVQYHQDL
jgi:hypothetical protein